MTRILIGTIAALLLIGAGLFWHNRSLSADLAVADRELTETRETLRVERENAALVREARKDLERDLTTLQAARDRIIERPNTNAQTSPDTLDAVRAVECLLSGACDAGTGD